MEEKKIIGFNFTKNDFRYCIINGTKPIPTIIDKGKIVYPNSMDTPDLMEWFETQLSLIIDKYKPNQISHKISLNLPTLEQIKSSCYPQAILNLLSKKKNIPINNYSSQAINQPTKFGQTKKTDLYAHMDTIIGTHPPHWDKATKDAVLVAWLNLL
jgi:Holliday junction resolvasome RuvABC endonuclease subunit